MAKPKKTSVVARMRLARTYLTEVLLNLPVKADEIQVSTLLSMLDHFADHPDSYLDFINEPRNTK